KVTDTVVEHVDPMQPKRQGKIKYVIVGVGEASHSGTNFGEEQVVLLSSLLFR
ncbi:hypothetical protein Tco_0571991, partial [Tanacetum coccineum]